MKKKLLFLVKNIEEIVAGICLSVMTFVTFLNVICRYVFGKSLIWGDEVAILLMGWAVFLGISAAFKRNLHLGIEFFANKLPMKKQEILRGIIMILLVFTNIFLAYISLSFIMNTMKRTLILRVSYKFIYCAPLIGFSFMSAYSIYYVYLFFFKRDKFNLRYVKSEETPVVKEAKA